MAQVFQLLVAAIVGFFFGLATEHFKGRLDVWVKRNRIRKGLYSEIVWLYTLVETFSTSLTQHPNQLTKDWENLKSELQPTYYPLARVEPLFAELQEANVIRGLYLNLSLLAACPSPEQWLVEANTIVAVYNRMINSGQLKTKRIKPLISQTHGVTASPNSTSSVPHPPEGELERCRIDAKQKDR